MPRFVSNGQVLTAHVPSRNQVDQRIHGLACTGHHHQAAGVLVQAMHDACAGHFAGLRVQRQQTIEQRAAPVARGRMHHQTRGLVDDTQVSVFVDHIDGHVFRHKCL